MSEPLFIVCRSASDKLAPGAERGFSCVLCDLPVQVSEVGRTQLETMGAKPICNKCANYLAKRDLAEIAAVNPLAEAEAKKRGVDVLTALDQSARGYK